jgi:NAD(P)H dehydrogenase (quinone)
MTARIAIVYSSARGHTRTLATHVAKGAAEVSEIETELFQILPTQIDPDGRWQDDALMAKLTASDAIVFGTPTYMGSVPGLYKLFLDAAFLPWWFQQQWKDKIAAGFTNSASRSGDKLATLSQLSIFAAQMGMIWVGVGDPPGGNRADSTPDDVNHLGSWLGLMSQSPSGADDAASPSAGDRHTAERFGRRVALATRRWCAAAEDYPTQRLGEGESMRRDKAGLSEWQRHKD